MRAEDVLDRRLAPGPRIRLIGEMAWAYLRVRCGLRAARLPEVLIALRAQAPDTASQLVNPAAPFRLAWAVERTLARLPMDSRCLVRSLVLVSLLARRAVPCKLVIGVRPGEVFMAHAWVEVDGHPLLQGGQGEYERLTEL